LENGDRGVDVSGSEADEPGGLRRLEKGARLFEAVFTVAPLVLVGTTEPNGDHNLAPKHMAMPIGWSDRYCFACTPRHRTHANVERTGEFTVSYATPDQVVLVGQAAAERGPDHVRHELAALDTTPALAVNGVLVAEAHAALECELDEIVRRDDASLIIGRVVAAHALPDALRANDRDDADVIYQCPLTAYVAPGRLARIDRTTSFPYPARFSI
jgi:flavin reductase (DIM6/NTAB) family NADH-FMN oxidoreductase RutF